MKTESVEAMMRSHHNIPNDVAIKTTLVSSVHPGTGNPRRPYTTYRCEWSDGIFDH